MRRTPYVCHDCIRQLRGRLNEREIFHNVRQRYSTVTAQGRPFRCAVIGSGPAGFYSAYRMLQKIPSARIDMYESLPTPFGLVRFGVAPDHPEVKNCIDKFTEVANNPSFTFVGNVSIGTGPSDLPLSLLAPHYDAFLFAYGASKDRKLGIPGEDLKGVYSARSFVGWYNGLPEHEALRPNLSDSEEAVVIGQGNVALDIARILLSPLDRLRATDITEEAVDVLSKSRVKRVQVVGRRGPLQAAFTIKEVRELMHLPGVAFSSTAKDHFPADLKKLPRQLNRIAQVMSKGAVGSPGGSQKAWDLKFLRSPTSFDHDNVTTDSLGAVTLAQMKFTEDISSVAFDDLNGLRNMRVKRKVGEEAEVVKTGLAFRSVGYQSEPLEGLDEIGVLFDTNAGIIPSDVYGRILAPDRGPGNLTAGHVPGMYCAGWVKRGPTGVIASTMDDAFVSADIVARDWHDSVPFIGSSDISRESDQTKAGWEAVRAEAAQRDIRSVSWKDWEVIDAEERRRGKDKGKEREKMRSVQEMLSFLDK